MTKRKNSISYFVVITINFQFHPGLILPFPHHALTKADANSTQHVVQHEQCPPIQHHVRPSEPARHRIPRRSLGRGCGGQFFGVLCVLF